VEPTPLRSPRPDATAEVEAAPGRHHATIESGEAATRLDLVVARHLNVSRTRAATLIAIGAVAVNSRAERASYLVRAGDELLMDVPVPAKRTVEAEQIPLNVVYEDAALLVIDKPAGMVVHPAPGHWSGTLVNALAGRIPELAPTQQLEEDASGMQRAGIVHRLDKDTSGLLMVAKTERVHRLLAAAMTARRVRRRYAVLVWGHVKGDRMTIDAPIGRDPRDRKRMAIVSTGRTARTDLLRLARYDAADLLQAQLHTGRTHQIRVHAASIGHPVVGDDTYGGGGGRRITGLAPRRHFLHAAWLTLTHPITGETLDLRSPLPPDLQTSLAAVAGESAQEAGESAQEDILTQLGFYAA
jgi:23S rRNA pseudouridine1911/1915/1917 synthase